MKFKGIELKDNTEAELLIAIEIVNISNEDELDEYGEELEETLYDKVLDYDNCDVYIDFLDNNLLTTIYKDIIEANLDNINVTIGVHVDDEWFKREDGFEYNEDDVTLEEFLSNIEY